MKKCRVLVTRAGEISFPAYIPVTTFGNKYPMDDLIRPYLPRLAPAVMVSLHYAKQMKQHPRLPLFIDSGGFASLFKNARVKQKGGLGFIELDTAEGKEQIHPMEVLDFQEQFADVAFTLDFPIPPGADNRNAKRRQKLTIVNALWALDNRRRRDLPLYGCIQAWDVDSARDNARAYIDAPFDGIAIGGLVPRARDHELVTSIVAAVRDTIPDKPLHVFGIGKPSIVHKLYSIGVDSVDSSAYVQYAAEGKFLDGQLIPKHSINTMDRMHIALCNLASATAKPLPLSFASRFQTPTVTERK